VAITVRSTLFADYLVRVRQIAYLEFRKSAARIGASEKENRAKKDASKHGR
jgi:hypothetical protein